jgi:hypothetical protein
MSLLNARKQHSGASKLPPYTIVRCPLNGHQPSLCHGLCVPIEGKGLCGRPAAHGMMGRTQLAIAQYKAREAAAAS